jgi:hypothetical protein
MMPSTTARRGAMQARRSSDSTRYALTSMNVMAHQPSPTTSYPSVKVERCGILTTGNPCVSSVMQEKPGRRASGKGVGGRKIFFYICDTSQRTWTKRLVLKCLQQSNYNGQTNNIN